jgi:hypothetical protein
MSSTNKRRIVKYLIIALLFIIVGWTALTIYVESTGPSKQWRFGNENDNKKALLIFDPDPFYNLDEQICISIGKALADSSFDVQVATVAAADQFKSEQFDVIVYCANTYNWRPDWSIKSFIENNKEFIAEKNSVAITLGAGSTEASQKHLEELIENSNGKLIGSYSVWLWRPNDETKIEESNVDVAVSMAQSWGKQIAQKVK